ncbi:hypothetical protein L0152_22550 [bacterium]|nr:hypothetical protein [bacterium]
MLGIILAQGFCLEADIETDIEKLFAAEEVAESDGETMDGLVVEHGEALLPFLKSKLNDSNEDHRGLAIYGISMIGGLEAREILRKEYEQKSDIEERAWAKATLCRVMASTKTEADIDFLIASLKGPGLTDEGETIWQPKEAAALALGILRVESALPGLKNCSEYNNWGIDSHACLTALRWISGKKIETPQEKVAGEEDQIILKIFRTGIPRIDESNSFFEKARNRRWVHAQNEWRFEHIVSAAAVKDSPAISFETIISSDKQRAMVNVGLIFGRLNGSGYTYMLKKGKGGWEVTALIHSWIS